MKIEKMKIGKTPALLWGEASKKLYLYIHGQDGNKEEAEAFSQIVCKDGWQVLSLDLPEHGERHNETNAFYPWCVVPELEQVMNYANLNWDETALFANSIGAYFSLLSFAEAPLKQCLFVSPVLDMKQLINDMMMWADVTEERLKNEKNIPTTFGQTLMWDYYAYAKEHPILNWEIPTHILYGENDNLTSVDTVNRFVQKFNCHLTVMENGEHWFHTPNQLTFLYNWVEKATK